MRTLAHEHPTTLDEVLGLRLAPAGQARSRARGTDLIVRLRDGTARPSTIVDIKGISPERVWRALGEANLDGLPARPDPRA